MEQAPIVTSGLHASTTTIRPPPHNAEHEHNTDKPGGTSPETPRASLQGAEGAVPTLLVRRKEAVADGMAAAQGYRPGKLAD